MENLRELVRKQLKEMAAPKTLYKINNPTKANELINLYAQASNYKWIGDMIQIINDAGEDGILTENIIEGLYREYQENKTSQNVNPPLKRLTDSGVLILSKVKK
jgi:hypothetical protein